MESFSLIVESLGGKFYKKNKNFQLSRKKNKKLLADKGDGDSKKNKNFSLSSKN